MFFEEPEDGDAADDHDEGERYDKYPKADRRSSELWHLEPTRCITWWRLGHRRGLNVNGDRTRTGLVCVALNQTLGSAINVHKSD